MTEPTPFLRRPVPDEMPQSVVLAGVIGGIIAAIWAVLAIMLIPFAVMIGSFVALWALACAGACALNFAALWGYAGRRELVRWSAIAQAAVFIPVMWILSADFSPFTIGLLALHALLLLLPPAHRWFRGGALPFP